MFLNNQADQCLLSGFVLFSKESDKGFMQKQFPKGGGSSTSCSRFQNSSLSSVELRQAKLQRTKNIMSIFLYFHSFLSVSWFSIDIQRLALTLKTVDRLGSGYLEIQRSYLCLPRFQDHLQNMVENPHSFCPHMWRWGSAKLLSFQSVLRASHHLPRNTKETFVQIKQIVQITP